MTQRERVFHAGLALMVVASVPIAASAQEIDIGGQIRPRFEVRTEVPEGLLSDDQREITTMRSRLSLRAALAPTVTAFLQVQDVRAWGEELSTTATSAYGLDVHQAWAELGDPDAGAIAVRLGRQELAYGGERLLGALNWAQQARAFDGLRLRSRPLQGLALDALVLRIGEDDAARPDAGLYGLYGTLDAAGALHAYALYHTADMLVPAGEASVDTEDDTDQYTLGGRWQSGVGDVTWRLEAAYQTGKRIGVGAPDRADVSAYLLAARIGTKLGDRLDASVWYDRLSGDDDPADEEIRVFDTLFATNHKFYGYMDYFLNIPVDTRGRGLQDVALKASYRIHEDVRLNADMHAFFLTATEGLDSGHVGEELDFTVGWAYGPGVGLTGGLSYLWTGDAWTDALGRSDADPFWGYLMLDVTF